MKYEDLELNCDKVTISLYTDSNILHSKWVEVNKTFLLKSFEKSVFYDELKNIICEE